MENDHSSTHVPPVWNHSTFLCYCGNNTQSLCIGVSGPIMQFPVINVLYGKHIDVNPFSITFGKKFQNRTRHNTVVYMKLLYILHLSILTLNMLTKSILKICFNAFALLGFAWFSTIYYEQAPISPPPKKNKIMIIIIKNNFDLYTQDNNIKLSYIHFKYKIGNLYLRNICLG